MKNTQKYEENIYLNRFHFPVQAIYSYIFANMNDSNNTELWSITEFLTFGIGTCKNWMFKH